MSNVDITVVTQHDMSALNMGKWEKAEKEKGENACRVFHLGKGNDYGNKKYVSQG